ncbi:MAG: hypothetical protein RIC89_14430 [Pseudomonadales bacterium]
MDFVPPLRCNYEEMDERSASYLQKLDHAIHVAACAESGSVALSVAARAIYAWTSVSQEFFHDPPEEVRITDLEKYVQIHNKLLTAAIAASTAHNFEWSPATSK